MQENKLENGAKKSSVPDNLETNLENYLNLTDWLYIFAFSSIPVIGLIALIVISIRKPKTGKGIDRRQYARAKLLHKLVTYGILIVCGVLAYMIVRPYAIEFLDKLEML